jgi:hypothetical protein
MSKGEFSDIAKRRKPKAVPAGDVEAAINAAKIDGTAKPVRGKAKRVGVEIPEEVYTALKIKALQDGTSVSDLMRLWITEYLSGER